MKYIYVLMLIVSCLSLSCSNDYSAKTNPQPLLMENSATDHKEYLNSQEFYLFSLREGDTNRVKEYIDNKDAVPFDAINGEVDTYRYGILPIEVIIDIYRKNSTDLGLYGGGINGINGINAYKSTPLAIAAGRGHTAIVKVLIEAGANLETASTPSPLFLATLGGHKEIVRELINAGANVNNSHDIIMGEIFARSVLLPPSSSPTTPHRLALTPLLGATLSEDLDLVQELLEEGAYIDQPIIYLNKNNPSPTILPANEQLTIISVASLTGNATIVDALVRAGANINERYIYDIAHDDITITTVFSPLKLAVLSYFAEGVINVLCGAGATVDSSTEEIFEEISTVEPGRVLPDRDKLLDVGTGLTPKKHGIMMVFYNIITMGEACQN